MEERQGPSGAYLQWQFTIGDNGRKVAVLGFTSLELEPTEKTRQYVVTLLGRPPAPDKVLDTDTLIGARCRVVVTVKERANGGSVNRVEPVLPWCEGKAEEPLPF
jgi:hypothetical protein